MSADKKKEIIQTKHFIWAFLVVAVISLSMMVVQTLNVQGIPGPLLYVQKEMIVKKVGADNFQKMIRFLSPQGLAIICVGGGQPAASVAAAVQRYADKNGKDIKKFISSLNLSAQDHDVLDRYFVLYYQRQILADMSICADLKKDIAAGKFYP